MTGIRERLSTDYTTPFSLPAYKPSFPTFVTDRRDRSTSGYFSGPCDFRCLYGRPDSAGGRGTASA